MVQVDQTTQQNAVLVEAGTAATESMETQARGLTAAMAIFKLSQSQAA